MRPADAFPFFRVSKSRSRSDSWSCMNPYWPLLNRFNLAAPGRSDQEKNLDRNLQPFRAPYVTIVAFIIATLCGTLSKVVLKVERHLERDLSGEGGPLCSFCERGYAPNLLYCIFVAFLGLPPTPSKYRVDELRAQNRESGLTFVVLVRGTTFEDGDWHLPIEIWSSAALGPLIARALLRVDLRRCLPMYTPSHSRVALQRL
jgi:hypothetical protein